MKSSVLLGALMVIVFSGVLGRPSTEDRDDQTTSKERICGYEVRKPNSHIPHSKINNGILFN